MIKLDERIIFTRWTMVHLVKIILSSSLIIKQKMDTVYHTICVYVFSPTLAKNSCDTTADARSVCATLQCWNVFESSLSPIADNICFTQQDFWMKHPEDEVWKFMFLSRVRFKTCFMTKIVRRTRSHTITEQKTTYFYMMQYRIVFKRNYTSQYNRSPVSACHWTNCTEEMSK